MGVVVPILGLDAAQQRRSAAFAPRKGRVVVTDGFTFARSKQGLAISYTWGGGSYRNTVEIIPVGIGRYSILRCGKFDRTVTGRHLLAALSDYRQSAAVALLDRQMAERAAL